MTTTWKLLLLCLIGAVTQFDVNFAWAEGTTSLELFQKGNAAYQSKDYQKAIGYYESASKEGSSSSLEFNLGNAYFKEKQFAKSILHYERAQRLAPNDEDIQFNLRVASVKTVDKIDVMPQIFYERWWITFTQRMNERSWSLLFIGSIWLIFIACFVYFFATTIRTRKIALGFSFVSLLVAVLLYFTASFRKHIEYDSDAAIVMTTSVYVKSSPDEKGNDLLILHEGTKVELLDELGEWKKIKIANGTVGWINSATIEKI